MLNQTVRTLKMTYQKKYEALRHSLMLSNEYLKYQEVGIFLQQLNGQLAANEISHTQAFFNLLLECAKHTNLISLDVDFAKMSTPFSLGLMDVKGGINEIFYRREFSETQFEHNAEGDGVKYTETLIYDHALTLSETERMFVSIFFNAQKILSKEELKALVSADIVTLTGELANDEPILNKINWQIALAVYQKMNTSNIEQDQIICQKILCGYLKNYWKAEDVIFTHQEFAKETISINDFIYYRMSQTAIGAELDKPNENTLYDHVMKLKSKPNLVDTDFIKEINAQYLLVDEQSKVQLKDFVAQLNNLAKSYKIIQKDIIDIESLQKKLQNSDLPALERPEILNNIKGIKERTAELKTKLMADAQVLHNEATIVFPKSETHSRKFNIASLSFIFLGGVMLALSLLAIAIVLALSLGAAALAGAAVIAGAGVGSVALGGSLRFFKSTDVHDNPLANKSNELITKLETRTNNLFKEEEESKSLHF